MEPMQEDPEDPGARLRERPGQLWRGRDPPEQLEEGGASTFLRLVAVARETTAGPGRGSERPCRTGEEEGVSGNGERFWFELKSS
jgi:hypothetical protein